MNEASDEQDDAMNAGLSIEQRELLQAKLRELPDTVPPRVVWERIAEQGRAEGLITRRPGKRIWGWLGSGAVAATAALVAFNLTSTTRDPDASPEPNVPQVAEAGANQPAISLNDLMLQSQRLEHELRLLPNQPHVVRAGTAATISELEDRIAAIDYRLNHPAIRLSRAEAEIYWRERVRLMNLLYNVRYAQVQRAVY